MEGFTPNASAFGQDASPGPTSFGANETNVTQKEHSNQSWTANGTRGGRGGSRGRGARGNITRGSSSSGRGKSFSNRSAVFNTNSSNGATEENEEEDSNDKITPFQSTSSSIQPQSSSSDTFQSSFATISKPLSKQVNFNSQLDSEPEEYRVSVPMNPLLEQESQLNALGGSKESDNDRKHRFENLPKQNRFFEMRTQRETLRAKYIRQGILPDPEKPTDLTEAKTLTGTCMEMCPEFEREEREFQNEGDTLEMFPNTNRIDPALAVKIYRRPAAGRELPLPEDVRPPEILRMTLDYLLHDLLPSNPGSPTFTSVQPFMWNRTRAIRQDFIVQGDGGELAIECHERIARYHILCLHWRGGVGAEGWSEQQELEQLRKTIRSLTEFYEDLRRRKGTISPNESEFRSYNLLLHMQDPETLREVEGLPSSILQTECVQVALKIRAYAQRSNNVLRRGRPLNTEATMNLWTRFFGELRRNPHVNYLLACLAENVFSPVRAGALKAMSKTYNVQHAPLPLDYLKRSLGLDKEEEARTFAIELGAEEAFDSNGKLIGLRLGKVSDDKPLPLSPFSATIVEARRGEFTAQDVVDGKASGAVPLINISIKNTQTRSVPPILQKKVPSPSSAGLNPSPQISSGSPFPPFTSKSPQQDAHIAPSTALSAKAPTFVPSAPTLQRTTFESSLSQGKSKTDTALPVKPTIATNDFAAAKPTFPPWPSQPAIPPTFSTLEQPERPPQSLGTGAFSFVMPQNGDKASAVKSSPFTFGTPQKSGEASANVSGGELSIGKPKIADSIPKVQPTQPKSIEESFHKDVSKEGRTESNGLPVPSTTPLATSPKKVVPAGPRRTINSVTNGLVSRLIQEFVSKKVHSITEQACLREVRLRHSESRRRLIEGCAESLCSDVLDEVVNDFLLSHVGEVLADEMRSRKLTATQWHRWRSALAKARLRNHQNARLIELRNKLERREVNKSLSSYQAFSKKIVKMRNANRHVLMEVDDNSLNERLIHARNDREDLWMRSTFLLSIVAIFEDLLAPNITTWTIGFSAPLDTDSQSTQWLRTKLSIDREPHAEIILRSDTLVHMMDLQAEEMDNSDERELGLVLFELDEKVTNDWKNSSGWEKEKDRLRKLSESEMVKKGKFVPKLMLICWTKNESVGTTSVEADSSLRKTIIKRMGLGALDANRHAYSQIEIWNVSQDGLTPQFSFEKHLQFLHVPIEFTNSRQSLLLEDIVATCVTCFRPILERIEFCVSRLEQISRGDQSNEESIQKNVYEAVRYAFEVSTILTQRVLSDVISVSEVVPDENVFDSTEEIPLPSTKAAEGVELTNFSFLLASSQLSRIRELFQEQSKDETGISLLQTWLTEQGKKMGACAGLPWSEYFDRLLFIYVDGLQSRWIETIFSTVEEIESNIQASKRLFVEATNEIEAKFRKFILERPISVTSHAKRRSQNDDLSEESSFIHDQRPFAKLRRTDENAQVVNVKKPTSSAIQSLRNLISSANQMLDQNE